MRLFLTLCAISIAACASAQIGGKTSFDFLNLHDNARLVALGGENVSTRDYDVNQFMYNPAALADTQAYYASINYQPFYADIKKTSLAYVLPTKRFGPIGFSMQYIGYGEFVERDESGLELGTFRSNEFAFGISKSHTQGPFTVGGTFKIAGSTIGNYNAYALLADIGGIWQHPARNFQIGLLFRNVGWAFDRYEKGTAVNTPFDILAGVSYKLEHMPLRLSLTTHHLYQFDIIYLDPLRQTTFNSDGEEIPEEKTFADKLGRHLVIGGEFQLAKGFHVRAGYNHLRRKELRLESSSGGAGFSWGVMLRIKSFEFNFTRAYYHVAGGTTVLTLTTDTQRLFKSRDKKSKKTNTNSSND